MDHKMVLINKDRVKVLVTLSIFFLIVPYIIFIWGTCRLVWCVFISIALFLCLFLSIKKIESIEFEEIGFEKRFLIFIFISAFILCLTFGTGGIMGVQAGDWTRHNACLSDLYNNSWPVLYQDGETFLNYYTAYYMLPVLVGKVFHSYSICELIMLIYTYVGVLLVLFWMFYLTKKHFFRNYFLFLTFSGLDCVGYLFVQGRMFTPIEHLDQWANITGTPGYHIANYQSMGTALRFSIHHYMPAFIISYILIYLIKKKNYSLCLLLFSLLFYWTPLVAAGMIPFMVFILFYEKFRIKKFLNMEGILALCSIVIPMAFCYLAPDLEKGSDNTLIIRGIGWMKENYVLLLLFIILEFGLHYFIIFRSNILLDDLDRGLLIIGFLTMSFLLFFDYGVGHDASMRGSVISWVIVFPYWIQALDASKGLIKRMIHVVIVLMVISSSTEYLAAINGVAWNADECKRAVLTPNTLEGWFAEFYYTAEKDSVFGKYFCKKVLEKQAINTIVCGESVQAYDITDYKYNHGVCEEDREVLIGSTAFENKELAEDVLKITDHNGNAHYAMYEILNPKFVVLKMYKDKDLSDMMFPNRFTVEEPQLFSTYLADVSDLTWNRGVSDDNKCILFEANDQLENLLEKSGMIISEGNKIYNFINFECDDEWFRIYLDEDADWDNLKYPNHIYIPY